MSWYDRRSDKRQLIEKILANPTYLPDSGLVNHLRIALQGMSYANLSNLKTIIELKLDQKREETIEKCQFGDQLERRAQL